MWIRINKMFVVPALTAHRNTPVSVKCRYTDLPGFKNLEGLTHNDLDRRDVSNRATTVARYVGSKWKFGN